MPMRAIQSKRLCHRLLGLAQRADDRGVQRGDLVFLDASTGECDTTATGFFPIGAAIADAGATDTSVFVRLDGGTRTAVPAP